MRDGLRAFRGVLPRERNRALIHRVVARERDLNASALRRIGKGPVLPADIFGNFHAAQVEHVLARRDGEHRAFVAVRKLDLRALEHLHRARIIERVPLAVLDRRPLAAKRFGRNEGDGVEIGDLVGDVRRLVVVCNAAGVIEGEIGGNRHAAVADERNGRGNAQPAQHVILSVELLRRQRDDNVGEHAAGERGAVHRQRPCIARFARRVRILVEDVGKDRAVIVRL